MKMLDQSPIYNKFM